jgi:hypothetical protein
MPDSHFPPAAVRSPRAAARAMKREALCVEAFVAGILLLSICALLYVLGLDAALGA